MYTWRNIKKAIAPTILALLGVVTEWIISGQLDELELRTILAGLVTSVVVFFVKNEPTPLA